MKKVYYINKAQEMHSVKPVNKKKSKVNRKKREKAKKMKKIRKKPEKNLLFQYIVLN